MRQVWTTSINPWADNQYGIEFPEDAEYEDKKYLLEKFKLLVDDHFSHNYPDFEPEIIVGDTKEYWLPALKVLVYHNGQYLSPGYNAVWHNMELTAECRAVRIAGSFMLDNEIMSQETVHSAPHEDCSCGIYGSVNLEEIYEYLHKDYSVSRHSSSPNGVGYVVSHNPRHSKHIDPYFENPAVRSRFEPRAVLCIIEPSPDAKVIRVRKGWKASHAFISEIIGETMSDVEASSLLSIAWHRNIDLRRVYENR